FSPPMMAYAAPIQPTTTTVIQRPVSLVTPNVSEILKILSRLIAPVYNTIGNNVTAKETNRNKAISDRVPLSNRLSRYSGMVVSPMRRYLGTKYTAAAMSARADVTSQAMMINPFL